MRNAWQEARSGRLIRRPSAAGLPLHGRSHFSKWFAARVPTLGQARTVSAADHGRLLGHDRPATWGTHVPSPRSIEEARIPYRFILRRSVRRSMPRALAVSLRRPWCCSRAATISRRSATERASFAASLRRRPPVVDGEWAANVRRRMDCGRFSGRMTSPLASNAAERRVLRSSLMFPGQEYAMRISQASGEISALGLPGGPVPNWRQCRASSRMSAPRSRSGGSRIDCPLRRQ